MVLLSTSSVSITPSAPKQWARDFSLVLAVYVFLYPLIVLNFSTSPRSFWALICMILLVSHHSWVHLTFLPPCPLLVSVSRF